MAQLSPAGLTKARRSFFVFNALNSSSFVLLSGSFVTLYALSLGASNAMVGLLNAFAYGTFFFLPLGKRIVRERSILKVFGTAWLWRFVAMTPALAAPLLVARGLNGLAFGLILLGVALFNILRGIGLIGNNPVLANLADGGAGPKRSDRGAFLVNVSIIASLAGLGTNLVVALAIGKAAPPWAFAASMGFGVAVGIAGALVLLARVPEPEGYRPDQSGSLLRSAREAFKEKPFRAYMESLFVLSLVAGMARSFLPVYAKTVFAQGDDAVMVYSLVASLGSLAMGLLTRLLVDRLGAKPLYVVYAAVTALSLAPLVVMGGPSGLLASPIWTIALLGFVNFLSSFGFAGEENVGQTYFFSLVKPERTLDLGVVYFLVYGLGGTVGSGAGGLILDALGGAGLSQAGAFRAFFGLLLLVLIVVILRMGRLARLGSVSVWASIGVMLSLRDLRAFNLLAKLDKSGDPTEEIELIRNIGAARGAGASRGAALPAQAGLLAYLASPRFDVRLEALLAIENMGELGPDAVEALANEVERQPYTTAYLAARILGKSSRSDEARRGRVLEVLRKAAAAPDYMLQASAMVALARLGDLEAAPRIEEIIASSRIPRVRISAAYALEILGSRSSVPVLLSCLRRERDPAFVSDELLLSTAEIAGIMPRFYGIYQSFMENEAAGLAALGDIATECLGEAPAAGCPAAGGRADFDAALAGILAEPCDGEPMGRLILERGAAGAGEAWQTDLALAEAALDPGPGYRGLRFLIAAYCLLRR
jgi:MFS family permease